MERVSGRPTFEPVQRCGTPGGVHRCHVQGGGQDDQVVELERVLVRVRQPGVQHELEGEAGLAVEGGALPDVLFREPHGVRGAAHGGPSGQLIEDIGRQLVPVVALLLLRGEERRPDARDVAAILQDVVEGGLVLRRAQVDDAAAR